MNALRIMFVKYYSFTKNEMAKLLITILFTLLTLPGPRKLLESTNTNLLAGRIPFTKGSATGFRNLRLGNNWGSHLVFGKRGYGAGATP
jgi:hypothetical protein